jgi:hypothetical protein
MGGKMTTTSLLIPFLAPLLSEFCGKSHKELRVDTQFVRFYVI